VIQYSLTQAYTVSTLSMINYTTLWGPVGYNVVGTGVCFGLNSNWTSWNPTFTPNNSIGCLLLECDGYGV
jgi:hypothetical protein